jgi:hypothetical protein
MRVNTRVKSISSAIESIHCRFKFVLIMHSYPLIGGIMVQHHPNGK